MTRIVRTAGELAELAQHVGDAYADLYDAAYRQGSSQDGMSINRPGAPLGDPTGSLAISGRHMRLRRKVKDVRNILMDVKPILKEANYVMAKAWAKHGGDSDLAQMLDQDTAQGGLTG